MYLKTLHMISDNPSAQCHTVLIIEDEAAIRDVLRELLELEGYSVMTAENGKEGFELLLKMERPCLILLDLMMPVWTGLEFLEAQTKSQTLAPVPVIVVSAFPEKVAPVQAAVAGFMRKPIDMEALLSTIHQFC